MQCDEHVLQCALSASHSSLQGCTPMQAHTRHLCDWIVSTQAPGSAPTIQHQRHSDSTLCRRNIWRIVLRPRRTHIDPGRTLLLLGQHTPKALSGPVQYTTCIYVGTTVALAADTDQKCNSNLTRCQLQYLEPGSRYFRARLGVLALKAKPSPEREGVQAVQVVQVALAAVFQAPG